MTISLVFFGSQHTFSKLPNCIHDVSEPMVTDNVEQAVSYIQDTPFGVVIIQASMDGSSELCHRLQEPVLSSTYCIVLEDRPLLFAEGNSENENSEIVVDALQKRADIYIPYDGCVLEAAPQSRLLSKQLEVALRTAKKYRGLNILSLTDALTGLKNRHALERDLPEQIEQARDGQTHLSVIMLEVDDFKQVNDRHGHHVGDLVLQQLANRLLYRLEGTLYRYMGDEFVIMSKKPCEETLSIAARLNSTVSKESFSIDSHSDILFINITISLGVTCLQLEDDAQGKSLLNRADRYMYRSKAAGRNRFMGCSDCLDSYNSQAISLPSTS